jgi:hypothetical protein
MALLRSGIGATTADPLGGVITKLETEKKANEAQQDLFATNANKMAASAAGLDDRSRQVAQTYAEAVEGMMDQYAQNPSSDLKRKIDNTMQMANQYITAASAKNTAYLDAARKVSENPLDYDITGDEAMAKYNEYTSAYQNTYFDPSSMQVMGMGAEGQYMPAFQDPTFSGENPLFFRKKGQMEKIKGLDDWANDNESSFDLQSPDLEKQVKDSVIAGTRGDAAWEQTIAMHWLQDKGEKLATFSETALTARVAQVINSPEEFQEAVNWFADQQVSQVRSSKERKVAASLAAAEKAERDALSKAFAGVFTPEDIPSGIRVDKAAPGVEEQTLGMAVSFEDRANLVGPAGAVDDLFKALESNEKLGVVKEEALNSTLGFRSLMRLKDDVVFGENDELAITAVNIGSDGKLYASVEELDEDEETINRTTRIYEATDDEYETLRMQLGDEVISALAKRSFASSEESRARAVKTRWERARAKESGQQVVEEDNKQQDGVKPMPKKNEEGETIKSKEERDYLEYLQGLGRSKLEIPLPGGVGTLSKPSFMRDKLQVFAENLMEVDDLQEQYRLINKEIVRATRERMEEQNQPRYQVNQAKLKNLNSYEDKLRELRERILLVEGVEETFVEGLPPEVQEAQRQGREVSLDEEGSVNIGT